jgi:protein TonB
VPIVVQHPFSFPSGPSRDISDSAAGIRDPQIGIVQPGTGTGINSILTGEYVQPVLRPDTTKPRPVSVVMESNLLHRVQPQYPAIARQIRLQGDVIIRAVISRAGAIEQATVLSGSPLLASAALDAVKQWRYRPYSLNGEPVEVETQITVKFILNQ